MNIESAAGIYGETEGINKALLINKIVEENRRIRRTQHKE